MKIQPVVWVLSIFLSAILMLGAGLSVQAQDVKNPQQPPSAQADEFDRGEIEAFVSAVRQVRQIRSKWESRLQESDNAGEAQTLQTQANVEMRSAVEDRGLTVETYNAIAVAAQHNPELAARITRLMKQSP